MSTVTGTVTSYITLSNSGSYTSPLVITSTGFVESVYAPKSLSAEVDNAGTIQGSLFGGGIDLAGNGQVTNSGTISPLFNSGANIVVIGGNGYVGNTSTIGATVDIGGTGSVVNSGLIGGNVTIYGGGVLQNDGTVRGGFSSDAGGNVVNTGTLGGVAFETTGTVSNSHGAYLGSIVGPFAPMTNFGTIGTVDSDSGNFTNAQGGSVGEVDIDGVATIANNGAVTNEIITDGGQVTNGAGAYLYGSVNIFDAAGTVLNYGTIANSLSDVHANGQVLLFDGGTVVNGESAQLAGQITTFGSATVNNLGTITEDGILALGGGNVTNGSSGDATATINGYSHGIETGGSVTTSVTNYGSVNATGSTGAGVYLDAPGIFVNNSPGTVSGYYAALEFGTGSTGAATNYGALDGGGSYGAGVLIKGTASATLINYGTIAGGGTYGAGIVLTGAGTLTLTERPGAEIYDGVYGDGLSTLILAGTKLDDIDSNIFGFSQIIDDTSADGEFGGYVFLPVGGTMTDNGDLVVAGTLLSEGSITETGTLDVTGTLIDDGTITGEVTLGGTLSQGGGRAQASRISGAREAGTALTTFGGLIQVGVNDVITNAGTAVYGVFASGTVANLGTISGTGENGRGVYLKAGGAVTNGSSSVTVARIEGYVAAVSSGPVATTVNNYATIEASGYGIGVALFGGGTVTNQFTGVITGGNGGVALGGAGTVANDGTIKQLNGAPGLGAAVGLGRGGTVTNGALPFGLVSTASSIIAVFGNGIAISGGDGTVLNYGTVDARSTNAVATKAQADGVLINGGHGLVQNGNSSSSAAVIYGSAYGVSLSFAGAVGSVVENYGTIGAIGGLGVGTSGGYVTNAKGAKITGTTGGVEIGGALSGLTNSGTITTTGTASSFGVFLSSAQSGRGVKNSYGGLIAGYQIGVYTNRVAETVINSGVIQATSNGGGADDGPPVVGILLGAGGSIQNTTQGSSPALIQGANFGIAAAIGNGYVVNTGQIQSYGTSGYAIKLGAGGTVVNQTTGIISGTQHGAVITSQTGRVLNEGTIKTQGSNASSVIGMDSGGYVLNGQQNSKATIQSGLGNAIQINGAAGTVDNYAIITQSGAPGITTGGATGFGVLFGSGGTVLNGINGTISGAGTGVGITGPGSVTNLGTIQGNGADPQSPAIGIYLSGSGTITNGSPTDATATILGDQGIQLKNGTVTVTNYGSITAQQGYGVEMIDSTTGTIKNFGTITEQDTPADAAVALGGNSYFVNYQSGVLNASVNGVRLNSPGWTVFNHGMITSTSSRAQAPNLLYGGVIARGFGTLTNTGAIVSSAQGVGVELAAGGVIDNGGPGSIQEQPASIKGGLAGIYLYGYFHGSATVTNTGVISGTIGIEIAAKDTSGNTLTNFGTIIGTGHTAVSFGSGPGMLLVEPDSVFQGVVANFHPGVTIDFVDTPADSYTLNSGILTLFDEEGQDAQLGLKLSGGATGVRVQYDGDGGTEVTAVSVPGALTGSGQTDTLFTSNNTGALVLGQTVGDPTMEYTQIGGLGPEWQFEGTGSFLGDGNDGELIWDDQTGAMVVAEDDGGTAAYTAIGGVGPEWQFEGNGSLLGQSTDDFVIWDGSSASPTYGAVVVSSAAGGSASYTQIGAVGPEWQFKGVGDYLGDGNVGFLIENSNSGALVVGEDVGGTAQYTLVGGLGPTTWQFEGTGDLLGHGQDDFLIWDGDSSDPSYGALVVGEVVNDEAQYTQIGAVGPEWQFLGVGDYDGASASEFLMRDGNSGTLVVGTVANGTATYEQVGGVGSEWNFHTSNPATLV